MLMVDRCYYKQLITRKNVEMYLNNPDAQQWFKTETTESDEVENL
jgi:hypothetical protein